MRGIKKKKGLKAKIKQMHLNKKKKIQRGIYV
jgi:hypothetical protein